MSDKMVMSVRTATRKFVRGEITRGRYEAVLIRYQDSKRRENAIEALQNAQSFCTGLYPTADGNSRIQERVIEACAVLQEYLGKARR